MVGDAGLYVLEPRSGGWTLPYVGGSGTDTLIFDADAPDNPPLIAGESAILGFTFEDIEHTITDESGQTASLVFEQWVYPD